MQLASHLRLSRCGIYQFRLVLPDNLAAIVGQKCIIQSLGTKRPEQARMAAYRLSARIIPFLRALRRTVAFDPDSIDTKNVRELIVKNLKITPDGGLSADYIETSADPVVAEREMRHLERLSRPAKALIPISEEAADRVLAEHEDFAAIVDAALAAKAAPTPAPPALACSIEEAIEAFIDNKSGTATTTRKAYRHRLNIFARLAGGEARMLHEIAPAECVKISEALTRLPRYAREVQSAEDMQRNPPAGKRIAAPTVKEYLIVIQDFFEWAIGSLRYPKGDNPFASIQKPSEGSHGGTGDGAEAFTDTELQQIFQPAFFASMKRPYQFWGPLIALFTGARSNEIAQLRVIDIVRENGLLCINITHEPNHPIPTQTKNPNSVRCIPLHQKLLEIGFEDFVADMKATGTQRLFGLPTGEDGKCERYLSRDFNEGLAVKAGVYKYRKKTLHSFRDTVFNRLAKGKVNKAYIDQWLGHAATSVQGKHYAVELTTDEALQQTSMALNYPNLDLADIRYQRGRWDEWVKSQLVPKEPRQKPRVSPKEAKAAMAVRKMARADLIAKKSAKTPSATS